MPKQPKWDATFLDESMDVIREMVDDAIASRRKVFEETYTMHSLVGPRRDDHDHGEARATPLTHPPPPGRRGHERRRRAWQRKLQSKSDARSRVAARSTARRCTPVAKRRTDFAA